MMTKKWLIPGAVLILTVAWWVSQSSGVEEEAYKAPSAVRGIEPTVSVQTASGELNPEIRKSAMLKLIQEDPDRAIAQAPTRKAWGALSPELQAVTPEPVSGQGELSVMFVGCDVDHPHLHDPVLKTTAWVNGRSFLVHMQGERSQETSREGVWLHGVALDGHLAVSSTPLRRLKPGEAGYREDVIRAEWKGKLFTFADPEAFDRAARELIRDEKASAGPLVSYRSVSL